MYLWEGGLFLNRLADPPLLDRLSFANKHASDHRPLITSTYVLNQQTSIKRAITTAKNKQM